MPYTQTSTSLGALSSATSGSWVAVPATPAASAASKAGPIVLIVASSVTSGGVVSIEGRRNIGGGFTDARELYRETVATNKNIIIPIEDLPENDGTFHELRIKVVSRTDGTYTGSLLTKAT
jgi:hypothetical protein